MTSRIPVMAKTALTSSRPNARPRPTGSPAERHDADAQGLLAERHAVVVGERQDGVGAEDQRGDELGLLDVGAGEGEDERDGEPDDHAVEERGADALPPAAATSGSRSAVDGGAQGRGS